MCSVLRPTLTSLLLVGSLDPACLEALSAGEMSLPFSSRFPLPTQVSSWRLKVAAHRYLQSGQVSTMSRLQIWMKVWDRPSCDQKS